MTPDLDPKQVKANADIVRVVGRYTRLKPGSKGEHVGLCPFHDDTNPSLSVNQEKLLFHCFGCGAEGDIFNFVMKVEGVEFPEALRSVADDCGIAVPASNGSPQRVNGAPKGVNSVPTPKSASQPKSKPKQGELVKTYDYADEEGKLLYQVCRYRDPRSFKLRRPNGRGGWIYNLPDEMRLVLYRLPEVLASETVFICEGEKDCDTLAGLGLVATTNAMGALPEKAKSPRKKWQKEWTNQLSGKNIVLLTDNDKAGRTHGKIVQKELRTSATEFLWVPVPAQHKDVTEWVDDGHDRDDLEALVSAERQRRRQGAAVSHFMHEADQNNPPTTEEDPTGKAPLVLDPRDPMATARRLLADEFTHKGTRILHRHRDEFYMWRKTRYVELDSAEMRARAYTFSESASVKNPKVALEPFKPSTRKISDIIDALKAAAHLPNDIEPPA